MLGRKHERQKRLVRGLESPNAVETRVVGKACERGYLLQIVNQQARVEFH